MNAKIISSHIFIPLQEQGSRTIPREVGTSAPDNQPVASPPIEFPQTITTTDLVPFQPRIVPSGSILVKEAVPKPSSAQMDLQER